MSDPNRHPLLTRPLLVRVGVGLMRMLGDPSLGNYLADRVIRRLLGPGHAGRVDQYSQHTVTLKEAVRTAVPGSTTQVQTFLAERELREMLGETRERAAELHLPALALAGHFELCYAMCRLLRPKIVVETGVGYGWTTIFILLALEKNGFGHLHSVELAAFAPSSKQYSGILVPDRLKHRWSLHFGPQHQQLPRILDEHHPVDFFHYDSDKTYHGMLRTYQMLWPELSTGGVLVSDDLNNDAFLDFADSQSVKPIVTIKPNDNARVGILVRT